MTALSGDLVVDVVVVGGGPAGSTAATFVAMHGHKVLLLEKAALPQYKIGESLLPATIHGICPMLGVDQAIKRANFIPKLGGTFIWGKDQQPWTFKFSESSKIPGPNATAYQVERMKFDLILLENARSKGVDVRENCLVVKGIVENGRVIGIQYLDESRNLRTVKCRYVVDASGHDGRLASLAGKRIVSPLFRNLALFGYYENGARLPAPNEGNIFTVAFELGWFWYIPLTPRLTSVGAVVAQEHGSTIAQGSEIAFEQFLRACPSIQGMLANASRVTTGPYGKLRVRKDFSYTNEKFSAPGLILVGDAACFIDPVFSSGVHLATYSALLAARSINSVLRGELPEAQCFEEFEARYRREYSLFHDFLLAFYDANENTGSPFWSARGITKSSNIDMDYYVSLVAGVGSSGERLYESSEEFLRSRRNLGETLFPHCGNEAHRPNNEQNGRRLRFFEQVGKEVTQLKIQASFREKRPAEKPLFRGGLAPSPDGLSWVLAS